MDVAEEKQDEDRLSSGVLAGTDSVNNANNTSTSTNHITTSSGNDEVDFMNYMTKDKVDSEEMKDLKEQQEKIESWLKEVNSKIYELETSYLDETTFGNVVRGWDLDGRLGPLHRARGVVEEKERLFTYSSYAQVLERKNQPEITIIEKSFGTNNNKNNNNGNNNQQKQKKYNKKRKNEYEDWNGGEDY